MMKLVELEAGRLYHIINQATNSIAAIVRPRPHEGVWIASEPRTQRVLARSDRREDLPQLLAKRA